jgi:glutathione S-transferase
VKLYSSRFAPSPRRVRMCAAEKGLALEIVEVDIAAGATAAPAFLAINPFGEVPVLELDDGTRIAESITICRWLEEQQPEPALFGRSPRERAAINQAVDRLMFRLYLPMSNVFRHTHAWWAARIEQIPAWGAAQRDAVWAELGALEAALGEREFLVGGALTMADIVGYTTVDFGKPSSVRLGDAHPNLKRWYAAINGRASARA